MKKFKKVLALLLVTILGVSLLAGCSNESNETGTEQNDVSDDVTNGKVKIGYVNWSDGVAITNLAKVVLEDKMGYDVEITTADAGVIFTSVADGDYDAFMHTWLPVTHKGYIDKHGDDTVDLGSNFDGAKIGLVVPEYMDIDSIEELNDKKDEFEGEIIGVEAGAGIMEVTNKAIEEYDLDYELLQGSEAVMMASLKEAIENEEPIVITGWTPHWKFAEWDLKFLEDSKEVYGDSETISTTARKDIEEDLPEVTEFFKNFKLNQDQLGDLMGRINESDDAESVAREWMKENNELVESWIPKR